METSDTPDMIKQAWKTPVLHTRGVEETLSGVNPFYTETDGYYPLEDDDYDGGGAS